METTSGSIDLGNTDAAVLLRVLADDSPDLTLVIDEQGTIGYASSASHPMLGLEPRAAIGTSLFEHCHESAHTQLERLLATCVAGESPASGQLRMSNERVETVCDEAINYRREFELTVRDARESIGGLVVVLHDISERITLEDAMTRKQALDAVGRLAGGIAHDFNNLLVVINGYSDFLSASPNLNNDEKETVTEIAAAGARAARLTSQLLSFSRRQMSSPRVQDANEIVADLVDLLKPVAGGHELVFEFQAEPCLLNVDERQLRDALIELVSNAATALGAFENGKIEVIVGAPDQLPALFEKQVGRYIGVCVRDNGPGMEEETHAHLFEPFFTTKEVGQGTGLGLSTVHGFVKQHHGYLFTDTDPGKGATFILYFPEALDAPAPTSTVQLPAIDVSGATILLVEDDETVRVMIRTLLSQDGYNVLEAASCSDAERVYTEHGPVSLLLTDMLLPDKNGQEVARRLRDHQPDLPVLYMSGYAGETNLIEEESNSFLQKPFTKGMLATKLVELLATRLPTEPTSPEHSANAEPSLETLEA